MATLKECRMWAENPYINPKTGRAIIINGPTYKTLKKECLKRNIFFKSPRKTAVKKRSSPCPKNKILNPSTQKCVKVDGKIGKKLTKGQTYNKTKVSVYNPDNIPQKTVITKNVTQPIMEYEDAVTKHRIATIVNDMDILNEDMEKFTIREPLSYEDVRVKTLSVPKEEALSYPDSNIKTISLPDQPIIISPQSGKNISSPAISPKSVQTFHTPAGIIKSGTRGGTLSGKTEVFYSPRDEIPVLKEVVSEESAKRTKSKGDLYVSPVQSTQSSRTVYGTPKSSNSPKSQYKTPKSTPSSKVYKTIEEPPVEVYRSPVPSPEKSFLTPRQVNTAEYEKLKEENRILQENWRQAIDLNNRLLKDTQNIDMLRYKNNKLADMGEYIYAKKMEVNDVNRDIYDVSTATATERRIKWKEEIPRADLIRLKQIMKKIEELPDENTKEIAISGTMHSNKIKNKVYELQVIYKMAKFHAKKITKNNPRAMELAIYNYNDRQKPTLQQEIYGESRVPDIAKR